MPTSWDINLRRLHLAVKLVLTMAAGSSDDFAQLHHLEQVVDLIVMAADLTKNDRTEDKGKTGKSKDDPDENEK